MVFTVDVGNTNIVLGGYRGDELVFVSRVATEAFKMEDQYAIEFASILALYSCKPEMFTGAIISSVVPPLLPVLKAALAKLLSCKVLVVSPGIKTGLHIKIDNPAILGGDLVCAAVAALEKYPTPSIIFDLGTATKISALDGDGSYLGCSIFPGVRVSLEALSTRTAQLPHINLDPVHTLIGTNSVDSMKSGVILGTASMMDGMVERYREALGGTATVVATGGLVSAIVPFCKSTITVDHNLVLDGLHLIYKKNVG